MACWFDGVLAKVEIAVCMFFFLPGSPCICLPVSLVSRFLLCLRIGVRIDCTSVLIFLIKRSVGLAHKTKQHPMNESVSKNKQIND